MRGAEKDTMLRMLDDYIEHIRVSKNKSLLARIYGIFTIKTKELTPIDLMIMQNTAILGNKKCGDKEFDLKGSLVGRKTQCNLEDPDTMLKKTLKDINFLEI